MSQPREMVITREIASNHSRSREPQLDTADTADMKATEDTDTTGDPLQLTLHPYRVESRGLPSATVPDPTRLSSLSRRLARALTIIQGDPVLVEMVSQADLPALPPMEVPALLHPTGSQGTLPLDQLEGQTV